MRFVDVQGRVAELMKGKVVIGHSLWLDLSGTCLESERMSEASLHCHLCMGHLSTCFSRNFMVFLTVLGIPHPAVATRDVALYQPFRNALRSPNSVVGLQTLMWRLMNRRAQDDKQCPVSVSRLFICDRNTYRILTICIALDPLSWRRPAPLWISIVRMPPSGRIMCPTISGPASSHRAPFPAAIPSDSALPLTFLLPERLAFL